MQDLTPKKGSVVVDTNADVAIISRLDVQGEPNNAGQIYMHSIGTYLKSTSNSPGSRWAGQHFRVVCQVSDLLKLLGTKYDLLTPAEPPEEELTELQRLQKTVARLEAQLKQQNDEFVPRPRMGIPTLQK